MVVAQVSSVTQTGGGERFGRYVLLERIGLGGMAEVFRAVANGVEGFARVFVIKRILKEKSTSKAFIDMFVSEARVSALLNHPNIVQIYDFGQVDGSYFLSMEYLRGKDLLSVMRQMRTDGKLMDPAIAAYITQQVAQGLHFAHSLTHSGGQSLNIVHRDVSPSNVMLLRAGGVKLLDFGIAKVGAQLQDQADTKAGVIKGKLSYLSPEQVQGKELDFRSDIFSLGVLFWEMLTGKRLFYENTDFDTMKNVIEKPVIPPSMRRPDAPTALDYIVVRALERDPTRRYGSAKELAEEIEAYLADVRFAPGSVPRLLDDLFGEDAGIHDSQVPDTLSGGRPLVNDDMAAGSLSVQPIPIDRTGGDRQAPPAPVAAGGGRKVGVLLGASGALAVAAVLAIVLRNPSPPGPPAPAGNPPGAAAAAPPVAPAPLAPGTIAVQGNPAPTTVSIRFETVPRGAEVLAPDGKRLGTTPTTFTLPRSTTAVSIVVRRKGFVESRHQIIPDRDLSALLTLIVERKNRRHGGSPAAKLEIMEIAPPEPASGAAPAVIEGAPPADNTTPPPVPGAPPAPATAPEPTQEAPKVDPFKDDTKTNGAPPPA